MKLFGWHPRCRFEVVAQVDYTYYEQCRECSKRRVRKEWSPATQGHFVDFGWVETGKWTVRP
jgi:hypothetical protein